MSQTRPVLALAQAQSILDAAEAGAAAKGIALSLAVLDDGGTLLAFRRMDGVHVGTVDVAIAKARAVILFKRPTSAFAKGLADGNLALLSLPGVVPLAGGVPISIGGAFAGAIGISGSSPENDEAIAELGAAAPSEGGE
ncbi:MAG: hypothetical protein ABS76_33605 [Pelagibacterium sp. SCN 64-44]|nr:MAG: hypothetical protein ABS76_33605 [Pelagibacterium sp. SCN 64-44]